MGLTFEIKGPLPEHAIRHLIREAEARMADGADAKATLVTVAQEYLAEQHAMDIKTAIDEAQGMADMMGEEVNLDVVLADVKAQIGADFDKTLNTYAGGPPQHLPNALAKAAVTAKQVIGANRGKYLSRLGIVDAYIKALVPATTTVGTHGSPELDADAAKLTALGADPGPTIEDLDADMAAMLGLDTTEGAPVPPPPFEQFAAAYAGGAAPPPPMSAGAPSAAPPGPDAPPPPPEPSNTRDAFVLFGKATDLDDAALATRLGISRSTMHNYVNGKTAKVKCPLAMARMMVAEIDLRIADLRTAADIFAQVRD